MSQRIRQLPRNKLATTVTTLKQDMQKLKTPQPVGGDILIVNGHPAIGNVIGPNTIAAGGAFIFNTTFTPNHDTITLWNILWTIYVDPVITGGFPDAAHAWPLGTSLTGGQWNQQQITPWLDFQDSSTTTNQRNFKVFIRNNDTASHTYYLVITPYLPQISS